MIRKGATGAALLAGLVASGSAHAQAADLLRARCADLMELRQNDRGQLIVWLHGYYAGAAQRPVIDRPKLDAAVAAIEQACERDRAMALIGMEARAIFLGEPLPQMQPAPPVTGANSATSPARTSPAPTR